MRPLSCILFVATVGAGPALAQMPTQAEQQAAATRMLGEGIGRELAKEAEALSAENHLAACQDDLGKAQAALKAAQAAAVAPKAADPPKAP